LALRNLNY